MGFNDEKEAINEDVQALNRLGYAQELLRRMSGFSNFAISMSIICILAGGITSFQFGFNSVGGASIGLGWPLACLFSLAVAATMGQVASAFPTAGGLYHWASILGGKGWGWATAWFNLVGLVTVLAAVNVGTYRFLLSPIGPLIGLNPDTPNATKEITVQIIVVFFITVSQGLFNHIGIRITTLLTDFSGYLILVVAAALTAALLFYAPSFEPMRLVRFTNYSGIPAGVDAIWPHTNNLVWLFALGLLLPAFTITGFDASAHTSEETVGAAINVPRGIVRSVIVSGFFGWIMLMAIVLAFPNMDEAARQAGNAFYWVVGNVLPHGLGWVLYIGIGIAQYLCGLATVTSASRMAYAFARDGGLPFSKHLRHVHPTHRTPVAAIWMVSIAAILFTVYTPVYSTIIAVCTIFLYISYILPTISGMLAYGRTWTVMGPWTIGRLYRPLALVCVVGGCLLMVIGMAPPNDQAMTVVGATVLVLLVWWWVWQRSRFQGPPQGIMLQQRQPAVVADEKPLDEVGTLA